jgi:predicted site-specific integrase-resolvase
MKTTEVMNYKINKAVIVCKNELSRIGFSFFGKLFKQFEIKIEVRNGD